MYSLEGVFCLKPAAVSQKSAGTDLSFCPDRPGASHACCAAMPVSSTLAEAPPNAYPALDLAEKDQHE
jgi:hypothetical protein